MIVSPATVSEIADFAVYVFINKRSFNINPLFFHQWINFFFVNGLLYVRRHLPIHQHIFPLLHLISQRKILLNFITEISFLFENVSSVWYFLSGVEVKLITHVNILHIWNRMTSWPLKEQIFFVFIHLNQLLHRSLRFNPFILRKIGISFFPQLFLQFFLLLFAHAIGVNAAK